MRALIQRVTSTQVFAVDKGAPNKKIASIGPGMLILVGFEPSDSPVTIEQIAQKVRTLRIFPDAEGKLNLSGPEVNAEYLIVSQFTLYADCKYGNRPSFDKAAPKPMAKEFYEHFVTTFTRLIGNNTVKSTPFGSYLHIDLTNDGPVTIWLDNKDVL